MPGSPEGGHEATADAAGQTIPRFVAGSRIIHWAHAAPFLFLLVSGLTLFIPSLKAVHVGGYRVIPLLHVLVGIAFILSPLPVYLSLPDRLRVNQDFRRLFRLDRTDPAWARYALDIALGSPVHAPPTGKFNLGQKLNSSFTVLVTCGLMLTGAVLAVNFFTKSLFSAGFVEQIFPLHDVLMLASLPVVAIHVYLGSLNPATRESLRGITRGAVRRSWARSHHGLWVDELESER